MVADPYFLSASAGAPRVHRRYQIDAGTHPDRGVEVFIAVEAPNTPEAADLLSSKVVWPGPEWDLLTRDRARIWDLGLDAEYAVAARGSQPERAVIYSWRIRDEGLVRESLRALFALDASPIDPVTIADTSLKMSPNKFDATTTSKEWGRRTKFIAAASTSRDSVSISGNSFATPRNTRSQSTML